MLPVARDIASGIASGFGYAVTPAETAGKAVVNFGKAVFKAIDEGDTEKLGKPAAELAAVASGGLITKQQITTIGNIMEYMTGEAYDFELRDLFFAKQKSRR